MRSIHLNHSPGDSKQNMVMSPAAMLSMKHKTPLKARTLSPSQAILSPNNDDYERAQVRAARAAAQRRKSLVAPEADKLHQKNFGEEDLLDKDQILDLYQNCIKLATENKINQRNTWELRLIDHISEIVNADDGEDVETNFQKASCTLEAGVKIYSYRVDSVHSETFKVLGGLTRTAANEADGEDLEHSPTIEGNEDENMTKKRDNQRKVTTSAATLESFDALNVKKFDVAFTVDPLFNQMSAQFDEGGAKGLLLNSLSVYNGCKLVFDSSDVPAKYVKSNGGLDGSALIDLSLVKECIQQLSLDMKRETEISPTLRELLVMLDDPCRKAAEMEGAKHQVETVEDSTGEISYEDMGDSSDHEMPNDLFEASNETNFMEPSEEFSDRNASWDMDYERQDDGEVSDQGITESFGHVFGDENETKQLVSWMTSGLDSRSNSWAGPDHWKFKKSQDLQKASEPVGKTSENKKSKSERFSIDFLNPPQVDMSAFAPCPDQKYLMMPQSTASASTLLPEDCHYQPEDLVRLFLQPSIMLVNHKRKHKVDTSGPSTDSFVMANMEWDDCASGAADNGWEDDYSHGDVVDFEEGGMIPQPRKVQKTEVNYDRTSKQIDVRALKETLWQNLQDASAAAEDINELGFSFKSLVSNLQRVSEVDMLQDISVHLCFICLLHLANEHNLCITGCSSLDELYIQNVVSEFCNSEVIDS